MGREVPTTDTCCTERQASRLYPSPCTVCLVHLRPPVAISLSRPFFLFLRRRPHHLCRSLFLVVHQPIAYHHRLSTQLKSRRRSSKSFPNSPHGSLHCPSSTHIANAARSSREGVRLYYTTTVTDRYGLDSACAVLVFGFATLQPSPWPLHCLLSFYTTYPVVSWPRACGFLCVCSFYGRLERNGTSMCSEA